MVKKNPAKTNKVVEKRPIDIYFEQLNDNFALGNKALYALFLTLSFFGIMGLIWMIPFPKLQFLVNLKMDTFLNWGSLFIAIVIYTYLKLAPTLSYLALFSISIMSFFIVQLEYVEQGGGPTVVAVCSIIVLVGLLGLLFLARNEKDMNANKFFQFLGLGPIWLWSKVFDKFNWRY